MNYSFIYQQLISRAQTRIINGYKERHHIIPRCMNGSDDISNIVDLTPEEHYLAHLLLVKIYPGNRPLLFAVKMMSGQGNNKKYGWIKRKLSSVGFSEEHRKNLSESLKGWGQRRTDITDKELEELLAKKDAKRIEKKNRLSITALIYAISGISSI